MNEKEIAEIRRRFRPDKNNITHVRGCYVNEKREIVSEFDPSLALMSQEESEKFLAILKRTCPAPPANTSSTSPSPLSRWWTATSTGSSWPCGAPG